MKKLIQLFLMSMALLTKDFYKMKKIIYTLVLSLLGLSGYAQTWSVGTGTLFTNPTTTKVGVGITPTELFHVNGGALKIGNGYDANSRAINMIKIGDGDYIQIGEWEADDMLSFKASRYNFTNGNVGIGITNPQSKLAVNGTITAKEIKVTLTGWPDYVFGKNYNLMPLKELEQFITKNSHLPEIPSAAEVEENGVQLGEMNAILLKKIEELTLYILQLEKRLSDVEKKGGE